MAQRRTRDKPSSNPHGTAPHTRHTRHARNAVPIGTELTTHPAPTRDDTRRRAPTRSDARRRRGHTANEANTGPAPRPPDYKREPFATHAGTRLKTRPSFSQVPMPLLAVTLFSCETCCFSCETCSVGSIKAVAKGAKASARSGLRTSAPGGAHDDKHQVWDGQFDAGADVRILRRGLSCTWLSDVVCCRHGRHGVAIFS